MIPDIIVIGSGPAGAQAAKAAIELDATVMLLDIGQDDVRARESIPNASFSTLRHTDAKQSSYFWGESEAYALDAEHRVAGHLTPPRNYVIEGAKARLPVVSGSFVPVQSLALGGLGAAWGAGCPSFEPFELESIGLPVREMATFYDDVVRDIGVSASWEDDTAEQLLSSRATQPPAEVDTNAHSLLRAYARNRENLRGLGFLLGRPPLALLTEPLPCSSFTREANPYFDMDFYGDAQRSIYRPRYTIEELRGHPNFTYHNDALAEVVKERGDEVEVTVVDQRGKRSVLVARRVIVAAGALNSARLLLRSHDMYDAAQPLLSNSMTFLVCANLAMLGREARDRRHSLAQLMATYSPAHRAGQRLAASIYSYRSLLNVRLASEFPMPARLGALAARLLTTALTIVGVHHPEVRSADKRITLQANGDRDVLAAEYRIASNEKDAISRDIRGIASCFRMLGCMPLRVVSTPPGASIHYAGTIPMQAPNETAPLQSDSKGRVIGSDRIYVADSSTWRALPAKGLTLTIMANARRIATEAVKAGRERG